MSEYTQKYAFVTGSSRGIGRAIALRLAAEGYHIFLNCSRSFDALEETRQEIEKIGTCTLVPGDIGNPDTVRKIFHTIAKTCDHLDVLVNNAGISHIGLLMDMTDEDWDKVLSDDELVTRALHYGIKIAGSPSAATPLLHGPVAAYELPQLFPELSPAVFQAVDRHTVGACDMTPLDMVVFVADAIEPNRHGDYAHALRKMVGESTLDELFFSCFAQGLVYVIQSGRYLYPTAITIYNHYAQLR